MNIQVIFTGGTIGSSVQGNYINTDHDMPYRLLAMYEQEEKAVGRQNALPHFDTCEPYTILSENLTGDDLNRLIACLSESVQHPYDGIIITHGTDTLQYTAAALSLLFEDAGIPIILVSSNYILDDPRANGLVNFRQAVDFICTGSGMNHTGVYISYCNAGDVPRMHKPAAVLPHLPYEDQIRSLPESLMQATNQKSTFNLQTGSNAFSRKVYFTDPCPVQYIKAMPGQAYPILLPHTKAILLETYHSGTLCTTGTALQDFVREAEQKNIPVYVTGIEDRTAYESTKAFTSFHLHILSPCSPVYAYMYLWLMTSR